MAQSVVVHKVYGIPLETEGGFGNLQLDTETEGADPNLKPKSSNVQNFSLADVDDEDCVERQLRDDVDDDNVGRWLQDEMTTAPKCAVDEVVDRDAAGVGGTDNEDEGGLTMTSVEHLSYSADVVTKATTTTETASDVDGVERQRDDDDARMRHDVSEADSDDDDKRSVRRLMQTTDERMQRRRDDYDVDDPDCDCSSCSPDVDELDYDDDDEDVDCQSLQEVDKVERRDDDGTRRDVERHFEDASTKSRRGGLINHKVDDDDVGAGSNDDGIVETRDKLDDDDVSQRDDVDHDKDVGGDSEDVVHDNVACLAAGALGSRPLGASSSWNSEFAAVSDGAEVGTFNIDGGPLNFGSQFDVPANFLQDLRKRYPMIFKTEEVVEDEVEDDDDDEDNVERRSPHNVDDEDADADDDDENYERRLSTAAEDDDDDVEHVERRSDNDVEQGVDLLTMFGLQAGESTAGNTYSGSELAELIGNDRVAMQRHLDALVKMTKDLTSGSSAERLGPVSEVDNDDDDDNDESVRQSRRVDEVIEDKDADVDDCDDDDDDDESVGQSCQVEDKVEDDAEDEEAEDSDDSGIDMAAIHARCPIRYVERFEVDDDDDDVGADNDDVDQPEQDEKVLMALRQLRQDALRFSVSNDVDGDDVNQRRLEDVEGDDDVDDIVEQPQVGRNAETTRSGAVDDDLEWFKFFDQAWASCVQAEAVAATSSSRTSGPALDLDGIFLKDDNYRQPGPQQGPQLGGLWLN